MRPISPIKMLRTQDGSPDGLRVLTYQEGQVYPAPGFPLSDFLRVVFVREGWAEEVPTDPPRADTVTEPAPAAESSTPPMVTRPDPKPEADEPCTATSPAGESCALKRHGTEVSHEWAPLKPVRTRRKRAPGGA
jgi:hypothetical protein